ncbi:MAG: asparaginase [Propionibacteriaceae bacterium]|uniref:Asparaginase/glutaminase family signature n=2 Tax=Propionibacterium ruminifibrarum TaxID=1962131 RepID=A0A375I844_9ACTN|nr:asparaginase [Propionibacterium ruminifibrarum]MBE6476770.1 asparaginase [Propionibacteriaceae bacterium]SPF69462.1 Asparaginase/glutaminase family signature [Propionibacterium ruminifibrarum]
MRTHVLYTGGTLGMVETPQGLAPGADLDRWLGNLLDGTDMAGTVEVTQFEHLIDSSNATPDDWRAIVDDLWAHRDAADAFVVLHGTDTMAYTSAALSYALTGFGKPVVLTGAQYPLGVVGSDAAPNVTGALRAAASGRLDGVAVFFGHKLLRGNRVTKVSSWAFEGFDSPGVPALALAGAPWQWNEPGQSGCGWADPEPYGRHDVLVLDLAPGISAQRLAAVLDPAPEAVVLRAFGTGNMPNEEPGLADVLTQTMAAGVPLVVASQCVQADVLLGHYEASHALASGGAISARDMTLEALYAKLVFLLSQGVRGAELARWMGANVAGELTL